ncbi:MAG TPA: heavy metal sensor histidine kinase [Burkholderiaceae bacterium]
MSLPILHRSLAVRATLLLGLIACGVTGMLGAYFFSTARTAILAHLDTQLVGRVEHFRRLVGNMQTIADLQERPLLFEAMLGAENDVLLLREPGHAPFVAVNPNHLTVPADVVGVAPDDPVAIEDVRVAGGGDMPTMHWVAGVARSGRDGRLVEVVAGHPLVNESKMITANRDRVLWSAVVAMLASTVLAGVVLRRGLRPLHRMAAEAARITPRSLDVRLTEQGAPNEVAEMVVAFNAMLDRIAVGYERLSEFSADLAHEIRTPVGALIGQTQVALNLARSPAEYQQLLESNLEELMRLNHIAENILFLAQADHAALAIEREPISVGDELQRIADYFEGPADEAGLRFEVAATGRAMANAGLFRRAVNNLVVNAVRHGRPGTIVRLRADQRADTTIVQVENEGVALPANRLDRLFDRFYRGDAARSRHEDSNGLGLAIVKAIMRLHGGEATVSCEASGLIRFELHFPA